MQTQTELKIALSRAGVTAYNEVWLDSRYSLPTRSWLVTTFGAAVAATLSRNGLDPWTEEAWDCDEFALMAMLQARLAHRLAGEGASLKTSLAVGMCGFERQPGSDLGHVIYFGMVREGEGLQVVFLEPQAQARAWRVVELTVWQRENMGFYVI